ncbi:PREDICTED: interleukin-1 receptor-associated kinase-like 2 [Chrysochloris asiatica]|uniref:Interleukin-1 receptor-associated kinase-like 2 n=1 Tax=Chrysochloris asiatica TaxID=185453 RepID=A0A9B0WXF4_CHRAS|nr:PREDICTED: interleukin-1 receptor-associated kinase-like 2 [Chrysochloris asiatica]
MSCYIYQLPSWVLDDLCRNMDTLSEWDWMQFASYVITDLTQLRKIKSMERVQGVSITRELLWWWGMRQATVQQLVDLLHHLQLYRAAQIILNWKVWLISARATCAQPGTCGWQLSELAENTVSVSEGDFGEMYRNGRATLDLGDGQVNVDDHVRRQVLAGCNLHLVLVVHTLLPDVLLLVQGLQEDEITVDGALRQHSLACAQLDVSTCIPKQEKLVSLAGDSLCWSEEDVVQATNDFNQNHKIREGTFAVIYKGQRHGTPFVFKKLNEVVCSSPGSIERFFQMEVQVCLRCCHPNILPLLGFFSGRQFHGLIHPYMANGSLQDRLQDPSDSDSLPWPLRVSICSGLLRAVGHLHGLEIIHSNVKSSNVLLDQNFTPKLAHPMAHVCPVNKRSKYTMMKTHLFQASAAYLPEDFIRVGQLTKRVDIFSCGIVLAEVLTGLPAMDNNRSPVYLKDLLLSEIPSSTTSLCSRKVAVEKVMAKEICHRYLEKRAGRLPEDCAEALVAAACLCLRRRNANLTEVCGSVAAVEERLRGQGTSLPWSELSEGTGTSSNTPEETDDVDNSLLEVTSSMAWAPSAGVASSLLPTEDGEGGPQARGEVEACANLASPQDVSSNGRLPFGASPALAFARLRTAGIIPGVRHRPV